MIRLYVESEFEEAQEVLGELGLSMKKIRKYMLKGIGNEVAKKARKAYKATGLAKQSGKLYGSIKAWVGARGDNVWMYTGPKRSGRGKEHDISYGYMLAHGYTSNPKKHTTKWERKKSGTVPGTRYMKFQIGEKWVTMKHGFRVAPHDFVEGPFTRWYGSGDYWKKVDKLIDKQVQNVMKKRRVEDDKRI